MDSISKEMYHHLRSLAELFIGIDADDAIRFHLNLIPDGYIEAFRIILNEVNAGR